MTTMFPLQFIQMIHILLIFKFSTALVIFIHTFFPDPSRFIPFWIWRKLAGKEVHRCSGTITAKQITDQLHSNNITEMRYTLQEFHFFSQVHDVHVHATEIDTNQLHKIPPITYQTQNRVCTQLHHKNSSVFLITGFNAYSYGPREHEMQPAKRRGEHGREHGRIS
jgi:hypothetical protein